MISVFNGRSRALGGGADDRDVYVQLSVRLRDYLFHFKGAKLNVLIVLALHSDAKGWSHPSIKLMERETGLDRSTILRALADLCDTLIDGHRVLLRKNTRGGNGRFSQNWYLIFPTADEVAHYETQSLDFEASSTSGNNANSPPGPVEPSGTESQNTDTVKSGAAENRSGEMRLGPNKDQVEPLLKKNHSNGDKPHTQAQAETQTVCVPKSKFDRETIERYAIKSHRYDRHHQRDGIRNPTGWAIAAHRSGAFDALIEEFLQSPTMFDIR